MYARRVALFVLRNKEGRVLLQHRSPTAKVLPDYWAFFGGGIEQGETPDDAVKREAKEELGIELKELTLFKRYEFQEEGGLYEKFVYISPINKLPEKIREQQKEGQNLGLFSLEEVVNLKISDNDRIILRDLFEST